MEVWVKNVPGKGKASIKALRLEVSLLILSDRKACGWEHKEGGGDQKEGCQILQIKTWDMQQNLNFR